MAVLRSRGRVLPRIFNRIVDRIISRVYSRSILADPSILFCANLSSNLDVAIGTGPLTFTRSTAGSFFDVADGVLKTAAIDVARFEAAGILLEGPGTNVVRHSEDLSDAAWTKVASSITANASTAPDNTVTMDTITEDSTTDAHGVFQLNTIAASATVTVSAFIKKGSRDIVYLQSGLTDLTIVWFNLTSGTVLSNLEVGTGTFIGATIESVNAGSFRCTLTCTTTEANPATIAALSSGDGVASYLGNGTGDADFWGVQTEVENFATSYITTAASSVTRGGDSLTIPVTSNDNIPIPSLEYTISFDVEIIGRSLADNQQLYSVIGETDRDSFINFSTGNVEAVNGSTTVTAGSISNDTVQRLAVTKDNSEFKLHQDGTSFTGAVTTATGTATGIAVGSDSVGGNCLFGHIRFFTIRKVALNDQQVIDLPLGCGGELLLEGGDNITQESDDLILLE